MDPCESDLFEVNFDLQETFSDLQTDFELKGILLKNDMKAFGLNKNEGKSIQSFWRKLDCCL